jgi:hypothetical protein
MSRNVTVILIYHCHKPIDVINIPQHWLKTERKCTDRNLHQVSMRTYRLGEVVFLRRRVGHLVPSL